jgi:gamma-glutamyltranspeptidase/glutathione hydrolase
MKKHALVVMLVAVLFTGLIATITAPTVASSNGMVAAVNNYAAEAGAKILEMGGNAIDAAIAVSLALGVVEPYASGFGGEGYAVITMADGSKYAIDFRSTAPMMATYEAIAEKGLKLSSISYTPMGVCVPGVLAGIKEAWLLGATLPLSVLAAPAIELARNGFIVDETFLKRRLTRTKDFSKVHSTFSTKDSSGKRGAFSRTLNWQTLSRELLKRV